MNVPSALSEAQAFDELWAQYADLVYNLAIRLTGSTKEGWQLARTAFLLARRDLPQMEGHTPTLWLSEKTVRVWYTPFQEQQSFWKRYFGRKKYQWETLLPDSVASGLTHLADRDEAILLLLKSLEYPQRMMAVLRLAEGYSVSDTREIAPLSDSQIVKYSTQAVDRLAQSLAKSGVNIPAPIPEKERVLSSFLREWKTLKAPLSLKADIIEKRVFQKRMLQEHIPNQYSLKGIVWVWVAALSLFIGSLGYYLVIGRQMRASIDEQLMHPGTESSPTPTNR